MVSERRKTSLVLVFLLLVGSPLLTVARRTRKARASETEDALRSRIDELTEEVGALHAQLGEKLTSSNPAASWLTWLWTLMTRTKVPPVVQGTRTDECYPDHMEDTVVEPACRAFACFPFWVSALGKVICFAFAQAGNLVFAPTTWVSEFSRGFADFRDDIKGDTEALVGLTLSWVLIIWLLNLVSRMILYCMHGGTFTLLDRAGKAFPLMQLSREIVAWVVAKRETRSPNREQTLRGEVQRVLHQMAREEVNALAPMRRITCFKCGQQGHIASECPLLMRRRRQGDAEAAPDQDVIMASQRPLPTVSAIQRLESEALDADRPAGRSAAQLVATGYLGPRGQKYPILLDTGSVINVLPESKLRKLGLSIETGLPEDRRFVRAFNGTVSPVIGSVKIKLKIGSWAADTQFYVIRGVSRVILGLEGLRDLEVNIDPLHSRVEKQGEVLLCEEYLETPPACCFVRVEGREASGSGSNDPN